jgi:hypothetical protein
LTMKSLKASSSMAEWEELTETTLGDLERCGAGEGGQGA